MLICFFVVLVAGPLPFIDFSNPMLLEEKSQQIFFTILFLNCVLVNALMLYIKPTSLAFSRFLSTNSSGPVFNLTSSVFKSKYKFPNRFIVLYISCWFLFQFYTLLNREWISLDTSRSDLWRKVAAEEALNGEGLAGLLIMLLNGVYLVVLHHALISQVRQIRSYAIFIFLATTVVTIFIAATSGLYRSTIVFQAFVMTIVYNLYVNKIPMKFLGVLAGFLVPLFLSFAASIREGRGGIDSIGFLQGLWGMATILEAKNLIELKQSGAITFEFGYQYILSLISFIPRFIWPEKPYTNFSFRMSEEIYGVAGEGGAWIHTFTPWGEGYLQFGILGTLLNTCLIFLLIVLVRSFLVRNPQYIICSIATSLSVFPVMLRGDLSSIVGSLYKFFFLILFVNSIIIILRSFTSPKRVV